MIRDFPSPEDLIALFECEPTVLLDSAPWMQNCLLFTAQYDKDAILCEIDSHKQQFTFKWHRDGQEVADLDLRGIQALHVLRSKTRASLRIVTEHYGLIIQTTIHLRPMMSIWSLQFMEELGG